jgi:hypothetical protein
MSIGKSVPNLISYLHEFVQNFSQSPAIWFELISFGVIFNSEITDKRVPLVSRRAPHRARAAPTARVKALSGRRHVPTTLLAPRSRPPPRAARHLARAAVVLTAASPGQRRLARAARLPTASRRRRLARPPVARHTAPPSPRRWAIASPPSPCVWAEREFGPMHPVKFY